MKQDYLQMKMLEVAPLVFASGQLFEADLPLIAKQNARSIVSTLPDNESGGQPLSADLARAAQELGIVFVHFPIDPGPISSDTSEAFAKACAELERPLIVCSHSGAHATKIWESSET